MPCTPKQLERSLLNMSGVSESSKKRGFSDFAEKIFYIDFLELGGARKAPFVLRTLEQIPCKAARK